MVIRKNATASVTVSKQNSA